MFTQFLNLLATIISVISLLIVTYGALIAFIAFIINELKIMKQKVLKIFCIIVTIRNSLNEERRRHGTRPASFPFFFRNPAIAV